MTRKNCALIGIILGSQKNSITLMTREKHSSKRGYRLRALG